uniref:Uncharacterized protein LOC101510739 isoform X2 n=1 Tax=Cicer arietinum TaxID=3827 RepID=A0A3Q7YG74_CICAR|nr:uncharacterized protein LOC101510739 isoform X2 [Cicer arietinum]
MSMSKIRSSAQLLMRMTFISSSSDLGIVWSFILFFLSTVISLINQVYLASRHDIIQLLDFNPSPGLHSIAIIALWPIEGTHGVPVQHWIQESELIHLYL